MSGLIRTTTNFKDRQVLQRQHLPVPLRTFRDINLLIIHCASGYNNVVITGIEGFTAIGRPVYFSD